MKVIGAMNTYKDSSLFSDIFKSDSNFLRIPRESFIDFSNQNINIKKLTFGKIQIENWNYESQIDEVFNKKLNATSNTDDISAIEKIRCDILEILNSSFNLSSIHIPYEISLSLVSGIPCTKLHADFLPLRLICTYLGPGTIFLPKESTRYTCLNAGSANKRVLVKGKPSLQAEPFEILLLKGRKFNKGEMKPCAHRSPEVFNSDKRLVLKVDFK
jgi:hypothetical protein